MSYYWFIFQADRQLVVTENQDGSYGVPLSEKCPIEYGQVKIHDITTINGITCKALEIEKADGFKTSGLRESYFLLNFDIYLAAGKAYEILYWDKTHQFCGKCATPLLFSSPISKKCPNCGFEIWPTVSTAIIVLVSRGNQILMTHGRNFKGNFYGLVSGFLETGESLEECVEREVLEETNIKIKNIRYYKSQPWPYPCGMMAGFFAEYKSGEIIMQESELTACEWFSKDNLPEIPPKLSMARMLIDYWLLNN